MKLYGLKDKDGKEYEVTLPDMTVPNAIDNRTFKFGDLSIKPVEPEFEFKVGQWVIAKEKYFRPYSPQLIISIGTDMYNIVQYNYFDDFDKTEKNGCTGNYLRHATPQEIEQHLRKICDEKGYKVGVRVNLKSCGKYVCDIMHNNYSYNATQDAFFIGGATIYTKGEFAEIVPEKKKLPKTKMELEILIKKLRVAKSLTLYNEDIDLFLNDYEDD